jgi:hypothetical protein
MRSTYWQLSWNRGMSNNLEWDKRVGRKHAKYECPIDSRHNCTGKRLGDLYVLPPMSPRFDFYWTWDSECVIRDSVLRSLQSQHFTGFDVRPVHLGAERDGEKALSSLWEIVVTGWAGMAAPESGVRLLEHCRACGRQQYTGFADSSLLVNEETWDGSDFFIVWPMSRGILITERVASFIQTMEWTGCSVTQLDQIPPVKGFGPLPLRLRMPEERARQLGEPLGIY